MTVPKTVRQVKTRLTQLRHFRDNVVQDRFHMQEHGSLLRVEVSVRMRQDVLHTVQFADGVRRELLQSMEIRRIPWGDWTVSVNHLLDMCTQCNMERTFFLFAFCMSSCSFWFHTLYFSRLLLFCYETAALPRYLRYWLTSLLLAILPSNC